MFKQNRNLLIIALIAIVNALGYGIIIPILYSYSKRFGLSDFANGLLFATFSLCQFIATPIIGRLSDKYGRRPLLIISLAGTVLSFLTMAFAPSALFLFLARALDGITAGNIPVASAVISDTTKPEERARGFGIIGASFGFGFIFGPAISAFTIHWGEQVPFLIAAAVTFVALILTYLILPETNKHLGEVRQGKLIDPVHLIKSLTDEAVGTTLLVSLLYSFAFAVFVYAFQPFALKILMITVRQISVIFTLTGVVGLIAQGFIIPRFTRVVGERRALAVAFIVMVMTFFGFFLSRSVEVFLVIALINALANAFVAPLIQALLSQEMDVKSQGSILGVNASYVSLGMIFGPIVGGILATINIPLPFLGGAVVLVLCFILSLQILRKPHPKVHAF